MAVTLDEESTNFEALRALQTSLCENVAARFGSDDNKASGGRGRKIVTVNGFRDEYYVISSLLDNRIKKGCYNGKCNDTPFQP